MDFIYDMSEHVFPLKLIFTLQLSKGHVTWNLMALENGFLQVPLEIMLWFIVDVRR